MVQMQLLMLVVVMMLLMVLTAAKMNEKAVPIPGKNRKDGMPSRD